MTPAQGAPVALAPAPDGGNAPVPEWIHILPAGAFVGRDGRSFKASDTAAIIAASLRLAPGKSLPVDYDHQIDLAPKVGAQAPASGWIKSLQARADGIWGRVEWTPLARARIAAREYRFISPVFLHTPGGEVSTLLRAALTNNPNLAQLASLNSAGQAMDKEQLLGALRELFSLPETADANAVLTAARNSVTAMNTPDPALFVPIDVFQRAVAEANKANLGLSLNEAERVVDDAIRDRRVMPWMREWGIALCTANAPAFKQFLDGVGPALNTLFSTLGTTADFSRQRAADGGGTPTLNPVAASLGLTAEDLAKYGR